MKITIYQEINPTFRVDDNVKEYDKNAYHKVFTLEYTKNTIGDDLAICNWLFDILNREIKPINFTGHSLSVGDIIEIDQSKYICASFGWNQIEWKES